MKTIAGWLRGLAQRIDPEDPEMLTVRDLRRPLSPDAQEYLEHRYIELNS